MAIIYTYPTVFPQANDILLGTEKDASLRNPTKNFLVSDLSKFIIVIGMPTAYILTSYFQVLNLVLVFGYLATST